MSECTILTHTEAETIRDAFGRYFPQTSNVFSSSKQQFLNDPHIEDRTERYFKSLKHVKIKPGARLVCEEIVWDGALHSLGCKLYLTLYGNKATLRECIIIDGSAASVWESLLLYKVVEGTAILSLESFRISDIPNRKLCRGCDTWMTDIQYHEVHSLSLNTNAVTINNDGTATILYRTEEYEASTNIKGYNIKQHAFTVNQARFDIGSLNFLEDTHLLEVQSSIHDIIDAINESQAFTAEENLHSGGFFAKFKSAIYSIESLLFFPVGLVMIPLTLILTNIVGLLCAIPVLSIVLILAMSIIWGVFYLILYILSAIQSKIPILTPIISIAGVPLSIIAQFIVGLFPDLGEKTAKAKKMMPLEMWPFTYDACKFLKSGYIADREFAHILLERCKSFPYNGLVIKEAMQNWKVGEMIARHNKDISKYHEPIEFF